MLRTAARVSRWKMRTLSTGTGGLGLSAFEQTVGNTRLVRLSHASRSTGCDIFGKAEYENPGGSIKVRDHHRRQQCARACSGDAGCAFVPRLK
jgi:hypothetical protein